MWTKVPPTQSGYYWVREDDLAVICLQPCGFFAFAGESTGYTPEWLVNHNWEFWSERIVEPDDLNVCHCGHLKENHDAFGLTCSNVALCGCSGFMGMREEG